MALLLSSCSTKKNTAQSRFWQSFTTRYNVYYNGSQAYIDASLEKEKGNKDNFTEQIPLYTVGNKASREIGKGNYEKAIEKAKKAIKLHSIPTKPKWDKQRPKNAKEIEWYSRKEYNPFLWKAWMLMGRSQFYEGAFDDAASTFAWMSRLYKTQPAIYGKARAWLAKCYIEQGWIYDAEDVIRNMQRDSIDWRAQKEWDYTLADYYLHTGELDKAATYLRKVVKHEMRATQKAREYYLLGQIEAAQGNKTAAYKAFKKVLKQNPPYELDFNARIAMTEVLAHGQAKQMISRLKRMARNDNNKDYLDQVYYAMGNIYLAQNDTAKAISAYEKGNEKATRTGVEKGVLLLHLGDLYWQMEKYGDAKRCYGEAIGLLDKERPDYKQLSDRSKVLDELVPYTDAIHLQDSLQLLAKMDEKERNEAIDRVIEALKKKEKEERDKAAEQNAQQVQNANAATNPNRPNPQTPLNNREQTFYFYNPQAVQQGKRSFEQLWGKRENADDWQRMNKTVVGGLFGNENENVNENDSLDAARLNPDADEENTDGKKKKKEEEDPANDPHKREYYMAQIPFTEEAVAASNETIKDGLFHSGIIFKDKLGNLTLSKKQFDRLRLEFPEFESMDEIYYHYFLLHSQRGETADAQAYVELLKENYPDSKWTTVVTDPYFEENARFGKHIEDSLYVATYEAFLADRHSEVMANTGISDTRFIMGENRDKFLFISGLSLLNMGQPDSCLSRMERVVKEYPKSSVSSLAGMIINGVKNGRTLRNANFSMNDVWDRRSSVMSDNDSIAERKLSDQRDVPHVFMFVYNPDSLNENQLLYQMARFNFTTFVARNFDVDIYQAEGLHHLEVNGFRSFDEAKQYANVLYKSNEKVKELTRKSRPIIISEENLPLLGTKYSYNEYDSFYVEHFQPLPVEREYMLYEPDETMIKKDTTDNMKPALPSKEAAPKGVDPVEPKKINENDNDNENGNGGVSGEEFSIEDNREEIELPSETEVVIPADNDQSAPTDNEIIIPADEPSEKTDDGIIVVDESKSEPAKDDDDGIIIEDEKESTDDLEDEYYELDGF